MPPATKLAGEYADVYEAPTVVDTTDDLWDDFDDSVYDKDDDQESVASGVVFNSPVPAVVLYDYVAVSDDELTITENEEVEVLEKDGEGWCKVRSKGFCLFPFLDTLKVRLHIAINRAHFVSWCMLYAYKKVTKCIREKMTLYFRG